MYFKIIFNFELFRNRYETNFLLTLIIFLDVRVIYNTSKMEKSKFSFIYFTRNVIIQIIKIHL